MAKTTGLFFMTAGLITLVASFFQTDPIWATGPYNPSSASTAAQPDWYMGWLEGALRLMPSWETAVLGHTIVWAVFIPAVVLPTATFVFLYAWPVLMRLLGREDNEAHHLLIAPRQRPLHTAVGTGFFAFYFMLFLSGSDDVLSNFLHISLNDTVLALRIAVFTIPLLVALATVRICRDLQGIPPRRRRAQRAQVRMSDGDHYEVFLEQVEHEAGLAPTGVPDHIVGIVGDPLVPKAASPGGGS
jgi:ubiquinol-cytochrome c reductase cytochrome b subunit